MFIVVLLSTKLIAKIFVLGRVAGAERVESSIAAMFIAVFIATVFIAAVFITVFIAEVKKNVIIES